MCVCMYVYINMFVKAPLAKTIVFNKTKMVQSQVPSSHSGAHVLSGL